MIVFIIVMTIVITIFEERFYMEIKLFDSELKVMEVLWERGESKAGELVKILKEETGWNRNTTYTVIKISVKRCNREN